VFATLMLGISIMRLQGMEVLSRLREAQMGWSMSRRSCWSTRWPWGLRACCSPFPGWSPTPGAAGARGAAAAAPVHGVALAPPGWPAVTAAREVPADPVPIIHLEGNSVASTTIEPQP
jgi:hypothetical protein